MNDLGSPVIWVANFGTAGVVIFLLLTDWLYTRSSYRTLEKARAADERRYEKDLADAKAAADAKDAALNALTAQITMHTLPQLVRSTTVLGEKVHPE